jgi:hypothetical protein
MILFCPWSRKWGSDLSRLEYFWKIYLQGFEAELSELTKADVKPVAIKPCDNRCCITLFARLKDPYNIPKKLKLEISLAAPIERRVLHTLARYQCYFSVSSTFISSVCPVLQCFS